MNDRREVVGGREGWKCITPLIRFEISISHLFGDAAVFFSFLLLAVPCDLPDLSSPTRD